MGCPGDRRAGPTHEIVSAAGRKILRCLWRRRCFMRRCWLSSLSSWGCFPAHGDLRLKMAIVYAGLMLLHLIGLHLLTGGVQIAIVTFTVFLRKIFPCAMLGGILVSTTRVNVFMAAMHRIHLPKAMIIPMTVMVRYIPVVREDWAYISDAMRMRDVAPTLKSLLVHPARTVECIYVPMMMAALKVADELSAAAVTRGLVKSTTTQLSAGDSFYYCRWRGGSSVYCVLW